MVASGDRSGVMWTVYILKSLKNNRLYTGSTNDLERRLKEHNSGKSTYTKATRPFTLIYKEDYNTRLEARQRERFLKTGKGRELLESLIKRA
jgi:putative endonuclease